MYKRCIAKLLLLRPTDLQFAFFAFTGSHHESSALVQARCTGHSLHFFGITDKSRWRDTTRTAIPSSLWTRPTRRKMKSKEVHDGTVFHLAAGELFAGFEKRADAGSGAGGCGGCARNSAVRGRCIQIHAHAGESQPRVKVFSIGPRKRAAR